jgi:hypothetical protein
LFANAVSCLVNACLASIVVESYSVKFQSNRDLAAWFSKSYCALFAIEQFKALPARYLDNKMLEAVPGIRSRSPYPMQIDSIRWRPDEKSSDS